MPYRVKREAPAMESPTSRKRARPAQEAVEDTDEEHIKELHELILQQGILSTLSPAAITRIANHPNAASIYGQQVHKRVTTYIRKRSERRKRGDPSLSDMINGYMAEISVLAQLSDGLLWATSFLWTLVKWSTHYRQTVYTLRDRKKTQQYFHEGRRGPLDNHPKSKAYYPRTIGLALSWLNPSDFPQKEHDVARQEIITLNKFAKIELQMAKDVQNKYEQNRDIQEALGTLSEGLADLVPKIRHLSYLDGGLMLAFDLIQFLDRQLFFYCEPGVKGMRRSGLDERADE
ncbi:hypothetical protein HYALB_00007509 [Hymenoscyphus albidus]|uniref:Uncharacterized protein n=1 Tax=Hymenoscyphus albidus TaxID=595503 RepID=A0A9N9M1N7_9HELO|nr:hypothetical protein HYALB_00007509 [Hymenoscyphus albidus]